MVFRIVKGVSAVFAGFFATRPLTAKKVLKLFRKGGFSKSTCEFTGADHLRSESLSITVSGSARGAQKISIGRPGARKDDLQLVFEDDHDGEYYAKMIRKQVNDLLRGFYVSMPL